MSILDVWKNRTAYRNSTGKYLVFEFEGGEQVMIPEAEARKIFEEHLKEKTGNILGETSL